MSSGGPAQVLRAALAPWRDRPLGLAVSGGGDSMAMLHLAADWARDGGPVLAAVTVDHGLRPEAAAEAAAVARACTELGIPHATLQWHWDGRGNVQDRARRARLQLIGDWARDRGLSAVALAHTEDDQAETFLMRLARGSGVDGLSGMAPAREAEGMLWLRPLLGVRRAALRDELKARGVVWAEDPSNDDATYDRVKARRALGLLGPLGLDAGRLADTAARLALARGALAAAAVTLAQATVTVEAGDVVIRQLPFARAPEETRLRILSAALLWVATGDYRPRLAQAQAALEGALQGRAQTLAGCRLLPEGEAPFAQRLRICRELQAVAGAVAAPGDLWDGRWRLSGPVAGPCEIRALGEEGLAECPDWRATGRPRAALLADPAVWRDGQLVAAPLAGRAGGWQAAVETDFIARLTRG